MTNLRLLSAALMVVGLAGLANAQQTCKAEVSVGVVNRDGESFRGLSPQDFLAHGPKGSVGVKSLAYDDGPRRIVIIADTKKTLSANVHKVETELVKTIIAGSRPEDSLALLTARGPGGTVKFGENRSGLLEALDAGANDHKDRGVLDAVMEAIDWFHDSRPGDAIILIAASTEGNHKSNPKTVAKALAAHQVRLFGLALGAVQTNNVTREGTVTSTSSQGMSYAQAGVGDFIYDTGDQDFYPLAMNSGGVVVPVINEQSQAGGEKLSDPRFQQFLKSRAQIVGNAVQALYRMQIDQPQISHPEGWSLDIKESIRKSSPNMHLLYNHELSPCS